MSVDRTKEQIEADDALTDAINKVRFAYYEDEHKDRGWVLAEYVVISLTLAVDDDGQELSAVTLIPKEGSIPLARLLGLLEYGRAVTIRTVTNDDS